MPRLFTVFIFTSFVFCCLGQSIFFVRDFQNVWKANSDGTGQTLLMSYPHFPAIESLAYDGKNDHIFIAANQQGPSFNVNSIDRVGTDGTGFVQLIDLGSGTVISLTYNPVDEKIYWMEIEGEGRIKRANTDGTVPELVLTDLDSAWRGMRLHVDNQELFWADRADPTMGFVGTIRKAPVGVGSSESVVWSNLGSVVLEGLDFDFATNQIYWVRDPNTIQRANVDGSGTVSTVIAGGVVGSNLHDIVVDRVNGKLLWQDLDADQIKSSELDGSNVVVIIDGGLGGFQISNGLAISNPDLPVALQSIVIQ